MKTIYKYPIGKGGRGDVLVLPAATDILSVESQGTNIVVYGLVDPDTKETERYDFIIFGTGESIDVDLSAYTFLDTVKLYDGSYMFHVFYRKLSW